MGTDIVKIRIEINLLLSFIITIRLLKWIAVQTESHHSKMYKPRINLPNVKDVVKVKLSKNFKRFKINPDNTIDVESNSCYFLDVPEIPLDSFRSATNFPTILGQYLCLIPISQNRFRIYSIRTMLSVLALFCQIAMTLLSFHWLKKSDVSIFKGGTTHVRKYSNTFFFLYANTHSKYF